MTKPPISSLHIILLAVALTPVFVGARADTKPAGPSSSPAQILPGTNSKEPISVDADKLVYFDKERKAIYSGSVVVIQGDTKMTCSAMTVYLNQSPAQGPDGLAGARAGPPSNSGIKRIEAAGPVTVVSKTQVATGDSATYDKGEDKVLLIGNVTLSDGQNVTKGEWLIYDLKTSQATIDPGAKSGRVHGQFIPNSGAGPASPATPAKAK